MPASSAALKLLIPLRCLVFFIISIALDFFIASPIQPIAFVCVGVIIVFPSVIVVN
jgi:hypothetical protein